jgi:hypothetical protein
MGDNIYLGDVTLTSTEERPQIHQRESGGIAKTLAALGLAAAGLGAGAAIPIAAYNMTRPETNVVVKPPSVIGDDTDTRYGLKIYRGED